MSYQLEQKRTLAFLRLPFEAKRRRVRPILALGRRLLKPLLVSMLGVGFVIWLLTSELFALREIEVTAGVEMGFVDFEQRLDPWLGRNLLRLDLDDIAESLSSDPWIGELSLRKVLPGRLALRVDRREAVALLRTVDGEYSYLDARGEIIERTAAGGEAELSDRLLVVATDSDGGQQRRLRALQLVSELSAEVPVQQAPGVRVVELLSTGDLQLHLHGLEYPILVREEQALESLRLLGSLHAPLLARGIEPRLVDLRFKGRMLVEPAAPEGNMES